MGANSQDNYLCDNYDPEMGIEAILTHFGGAYGISKSECQAGTMSCSSINYEITDYIPIVAQWS